jgi:hypothetical protein
MDIALLLCAFIAGGMLGMLIMAAYALSGRHSQAEERIRAQARLDIEARHPHPDRRWDGE